MAAKQTYANNCIQNIEKSRLRLLLARHMYARVCVCVCPSQVRRELASAIRDITGLVGCGGMLLYMASLIQGAWGALSQQGGAQQWPSLECTLYTANVVLGQGGQARRRDAGSSQAVGVLVGVCVACLTQLPGTHENTYTYTHAHAHTDTRSYT